MIFLRALRLLHSVISVSSALSVSILGFSAGLHV